MKTITAVLLFALFFVVSAQVQTFSPMGADECAVALAAGQKQCPASGQSFIPSIDGEQSCPYHVAVDVNGAIWAWNTARGFQRSSLLAPGPFDIHQVPNPPPVYHDNDIVPAGATEKCNPHRRTPETPPSGRCSVQSECAWQLDSQWWQYCCRRCQGRLPNCPEGNDLREGWCNHSTFHYILMEKWVCGVDGDPTGCRNQTKTIAGVGQVFASNTDCDGNPCTREMKGIDRISE